ncbi:MAG: hypothetical protein FJ087_21805, partial [Deltaproteobacteria bacterium]|nr:hypothetical protein [Deltaproteobacteria bacterium]
PPVYQLAAPQLADPVLLDRSVRAIRRLVARDSTRPGVVMWSVANEVWTFAPEAEGFVRALADAARTEDPSRPVMQAVVNEPLASFSEIDTGVAPVDVVGVNEYWGWYQGTSDQLGAYLDKAHARWPDKTFFLSEFGGDALRGRRSHRPPAEEDPFDHSYTEDFQVRLHRLHLRQAADREWLRGVMPWVWADFRMGWKPSTGRPHPRPGWNLKGLVDGRRRPKQSFFLYKAAYSKADGLAVPADPACGNGEVEIGEACDGGAGRPCADLGAAWASGDASCRADCAGYDTSGCLPAGPPGRYEVVKPAERDPARFADARCNDGSPFAFRVRPSPTGSRDWSISLRGGGFCDDAAVPCLRTPDLMSSVKLPDRTLFVPDDGETGGVVDRSQAANPDLFDANHVFAWYCSSDFWAGTGTEPRAFGNNPDSAWHFSGRLNVAAMIDTLAERYGLTDDPGTRVLFSGTSSGAFGVAGNADLLADLLPGAAADGRIRLLIDAGWLVHDWDEPDMRVMLAATSDADVMRRAWSEFHYRFSPPCERAMLDFGGHPGDCVFGYRFLPALAAPPPRGLGLPVMLQQSLMDHTFAAYHNKPDDPEAAARYGERQLADVLAVDPDPGASDGLSAWWFLGWSFYHDVVRATDQWVLGDPGSTLPEAISRFWNGAPPERVIWDPRRPPSP